MCSIHHTNPVRRRALVLAVVLCAAACGGGGGGDASGTSSVGNGAAAPPPVSNTNVAPPPPAVSSTDVAPPPPHMVTFQSGLENPWGLAFLPDGSMLVTERPGRLRHIDAAGSVVSPPIEGLPKMMVSGQGGLLDVVVDPAFASNRRIYFTYSEPDGDVSGTAVARAVLSADNTKLDSLTVILRQLPKKPGNQHFGGRLAFAPDGTLFVTLGERHDFRDEAQNPGNLLGKVMHITTDGAPAGVSSFAADPSAAKGLWSMGHRNPQGAAVHPQSGELWISEHGPQGGDEINRITPGSNYGWPVVSYGCEYGAPVGDACRIGGGTHAPKYVEPLTTWTPTSTAPSGMTFVTSDRFPEWKGNLLVAALAGKALWRLQLDGDAVTAREALFTDLGDRIRNVREGPDGWLYLLTDETNGRIIRIER